MKKTYVIYFKRLILATVIVLCLILVYNACLIENLTHMDEDDLEWVDEFSTRKIHLYKNQHGETDTLIITKYELNNSLCPFMNPFLKFEVSPDYEANALFNYSLRHNNEVLDGLFRIIKRKNDKEMTIITKLGDFWAEDTIRYAANTSRLRTYKVDEVRECLSNNEGKNPYIKNALMSFSWTKGIGLTSYEFENGDKYELCE